MAIYTLTIPNRLPGLNEYTNKNRTHPHAGASFKKKTEKTIGLEIKRQLPGLQMKNRVTLVFRWYEKDKRRDMDNIASAKKFILDALVSEKILVDDGWRFVEGFTDLFGVDKDNPRIEVDIVEATT